MEAHVGYIENVVKKADEIHKQKEIGKKINASIKQNAAAKIQGLVRVEMKLDLWKEKLKN
jgi:hypothetical protein